MSETVKAGDVWSHKGVDLNVARVHGGRVAYWFLDDGELAVETSSIEDLIRAFTLIERDGKPVRHFVQNVWYPCRIGQTRYVLEYLDDDLFRKYTNGSPEHMHVNQFDAIGEAIAIVWPA